MMRRKTYSKLRVLNVRHPGLSEKVDAMFAEFWPVRDVKHMLETNYGAHVSLSCLERYKSQQGRERRALAEQMSAAVRCSSDDPTTGSRDLGTRRAIALCNN